jgi:hypothetical protein
MALATQVYGDILVAEEPEEEEIVKEAHRVSFYLGSLLIVTAEDYRKDAHTIIGLSARLCDFIADLHHDGAIGRNISHIT